VNRSGHAQTLVPAQPGNQNALKAGVFSPRVIGSRMEEAEQAIATRDPDELLDELLRTEIARLIVIRDAMDQVLEEEGVRGRGGQAKTLVSLRLRLNTRLLKTVDAAEAQRALWPPAAVAPELGGDEARGPHFLEAIAQEHGYASIDLIAPNEFDPAAFLAAIVTSDDATISVDDQLQARDLLTEWRRRHPESCACFTTRSARDAAEFRAWMDELREAGHIAADLDVEIAERIRAAARGEFDDGSKCVKTTTAIETVVSERMRGSNPREAPSARVKDRVLNARLWQNLLSADTGISVRVRLKAFRALDRADAFRECTCGGVRSKLQMVEGRRDTICAYLVRLLAGRHYRAAVAAVELPETYLAVNDVIDATVRARSG